MYKVESRIFIYPFEEGKAMMAFDCVPAHMGEWKFPWVHVDFSTGSVYPS
jgi:hypothetical protein